MSKVTACTRSKTSLRLVAAAKSAKLVKQTSPASFVGESWLSAPRLMASSRGANATSTSTDTSTLIRQRRMAATASVARSTWAGQSGVSTTAVPPTAAIAATTATSRPKVDPAMR